MIATVLMILVTMIGMTLLFAFVTAYSDAYKAGVGGSVREVLTVEDIWINPTGTTNGPIPVQISVYNSGKVDSEITSVYLNGLSLKLTSSPVSNDFNLDIKIPVGEHKSFTIFWNMGANSIGSTPTFTIATKMGSSFEATP